MEEIKKQLQYVMNLIDADFKFTRTEIDNQIIYYVYNEEEEPIIELRIYK